MVQSRPATFQLVTDSQDFRQSRWGGPLLLTTDSVQSSRNLQKDPWRKKRLSHARKTVVVIVLFVLSGHFLHLVCVTPLCMVPSGVKIYSHRQAVKLWAL